MSCKRWAVDPICIIINSIQLSISDYASTILILFAMAVEVSHGRGGAGNIDADDTKYVDGEVVRSGVEGSHGDGAFSSGRGGTFFPLPMPSFS